MDQLSGKNSEEVTLNGDPNAWRREPRGWMVLCRGITGTFFLDVFKKQYCALLI